MRKFFSISIWTILCVCMIVFAGAFVEICFYKGTHPDLYIYQVLLQNLYPTIGALVSIVVSWLLVRVILYN